LYGFIEPLLLEEQALLNEPLLYINSKPNGKENLCRLFDQVESHQDERCAQD